MTARDLEAQSLVDPLLLHHLDEDWAVPCERAARPTADGDDCGGRNPAAWILWPVCGCAPLLYCAPCRDIVTGYRRLTCVHCGYRWRWRPWIPTAFRLIEPLNRRTT